MTTVPHLLLMFLAPASVAATPGSPCPSGDSTEPEVHTEPRGHAEVAVPSPELYCVELLPTAHAPGAEGRVELAPPATPFGVAVDRDGVHLYDFVSRVEGLPEPEELGAEYRVWVAWLSTPDFGTTIRLGEVGNGRRELGRAGLNTFLLLVSAEPHAEVEERSGPVVLRGVSPSMVMRPHDLAFILGEMVGGPDHPHPHAADPEDLPSHPLKRDPAHRHDPPPAARRARGEDGHGTHLHGVEAPEAADEVVWFPPPMHPRVQMPPGIMTLRPTVEPYLPSAPEGEAPPVRPTEVVRMADGDSIRLVAGPVLREIGGRTFLMYGFNDQVPGPLLSVEEDASIVIHFENRTELPSAVHWHGIRLDNRFDGVPGVTQDPVPPGGTFRYEVHVPDAGIYWYHPHVREDIQQDLGLYGNLYVESADPGYLPPADREEFVVLDDLLVGEGGLVPYGREEATHALMGRFGNVLLVNGTPGYDLEIRPGEVVRFHFTNVAATRTWNLSFDGPDGAAPKKVLASDVGRFEREEAVESVVISPAERYVVDVHFPEEGRYRLENRVQAIDHLFAEFFPEVDTLGTVTARGSEVAGGPGKRFEEVRGFEEVQREMERYREAMSGPVDHELVLTLELGELPFPLGPLVRYESVFSPPVEWAGTMPDMDWLATAGSARWILRDPATGAENMEIDWSFEVGDVVKLRLTNDADSFHPMQHPVHIHGQRFLVLSRNGVPAENLVWKDTALVPVGESVEILLELSNPGRWMVHCHIAEHLESGMMLVFDVNDGENR